jgi:hypothetical protein
MSILIHVSVVLHPNAGLSGDTLCLHSGAYRRTCSGRDILAVRWFTPADIAALPYTAIVGGERLRAILADAASNRRYPLSLLTEPG